MRVALTVHRSHRVAPPSLAAPAPIPAPALVSRWAAFVRGLLDPRSRMTLPSRIRQYDVFTQPRQWARCREAGWYHLSRARRAIDRADWDEAARHARKALQWDDTRAANFLALGEALMRRPQPDLPGARAALEAAFELDPSNSYIVERLRSVYERLGDGPAAARMLRLALAAGAPAQVWGPELARLESGAQMPLAS